MLIKLQAETNILDEDEFDSLPSDIDFNDFFPEKESVKDELEIHKLLQTYEQLPDHCIQLYFLS